MNTNEATSRKNIGRQLAKEFKLGVSSRYLCPSPTHQSNSPSYSIETNYCHSCKKIQSNNIVDLISGLIESNPKVFREYKPNKQEIRNRLLKSKLPLEFKKEKTRDDIVKEKEYSVELIERLLDSKKEQLKEVDNEHSQTLGSFEINKAEFDYLVSELRLSRISMPKFPATVFYQSLSKSNSISIPEAGLRIGPDFMKGTYSPTEIYFTTDIEKLVNSTPNGEQFIFGGDNWIPKTIKNAIENKTAKKIIVENKETFELILGFIAKNKLSLPEVQITNSSTTISPMTSAELQSYLSQTSIRPPEGVNYLNINKPKEFDDVIEVGGEYLLMGDSLDDKAKQLIKTGGIDIKDALAGDLSVKEISIDNFKADGSMIEYALDKLTLSKPTKNIMEEIDLINSMSKTQKDSFDIQLKVAKAIKEMFPDEFWGIKGSANNLNILHIMGVTSVNPANIPNLTPYSFLDPKTDKNPDFDFELSADQISRLLKKYPEFTKGINETSLGDRKHPCKYFLNLPIDMKVYQSGEYIPINSMDIEQTEATPIDLLTSNVVSRINKLQSKNGTKLKAPANYKVSKKSLEDDELPHFNNAVIRQLKGVDSKTEFNTDELANLCAVNRPIFYKSKVVLSDVKGNKYPFSVSLKKGYEVFTPLNNNAEGLINNGTITEDDVINFNYKSKQISKLKVEYHQSSYLLSLPKWAVAHEEETLKDTGGVIRYQEQLFMLLKKYSTLKASDILEIIKKIAHPSKAEEEVIKVTLDKNAPGAVVEQINFIIKSPDAFFFKKGHALFVAETARKMSFEIDRDKNGDKNCNLRAAPTSHSYTITI